MPYDINNPPDKLRGLPENKQRQWVHVYDSCMSTHGDDVTCQKMAWGVTGGWRDKQSSGKDQRIYVKEHIRTINGKEQKIPGHYRQATG